MNEEPPPRANRLPSGDLWLLAAAVVLHLVVYAPSLWNGFTFDDRKILLDDRLVAGSDSPWRAFTRSYFWDDPKQGFDYRPLTLLSLALDTRILGGSPRVVHLENILWAACGAALFAALARRVGASAGATLCTLLLLSCHPIRTEVVLSGVGRSVLLTFTFSMAALLAAHAFLRRGGALRAACSAALFALALLAKENAFATPLVLSVLVLYEARRPDAARWYARVAALALAWGAVLFAVFEARAAVLGGPLTGRNFRVGRSENLLAPLAPAARVRAAFGLVPLQAGLLTWPVELAADYSSNALTDEELTSGSSAALGAVVVVLALSLAAALVLQRAPAGFGLACALAFFLPFANFVSVSSSAVAERLLYPPAAGVCLAAACLLERVAAERRGVLLASTAVLCALGILRIERRIPEWRDDEALFRSLVRVRPGNGRAWMNLTVLDLTRRDADAAERDLTAALRADPSYVRSAEGMAEHAARIGRPDEEAALRRALSRMPARGPSR